MILVLNEIKWAEEKIHYPVLNESSYIVLARIARYYIDSGCTREEVRKKCENYILRCDPKASIPKWSDLIDSSIKRAYKRSLIVIPEIVVCKGETDKIWNSLKSPVQKRLAFTLLVISKYWDIVNPKNDHWVNCEEKDIMKMANIRGSTKRVSELFMALRDAGLIKFADRVDSLNIKVLFQEEGEPEVRVYDMRNIGYQYEKYRGGDYFECKNCGITTKLRSPNKGRTQIYCDDCAAKIDLRNRVNSVMRRRSAEKMLKI